MRNEDRHGYFQASPVENGHIPGVDVSLGRPATSSAARRGAVCTSVAPMQLRAAATSDLWWKNAIVYCLDVETFHDADGDGCGDMAGLIERLDHAAPPGASCLWLMPFYPTPNRDDGYDVADYLAVDPRLGDLGDVPDVIRHARDRGLRVIVDLVVNHTSDQHPWFRSARADRSSPYRDYYVWSDDPASEAGTTPDKWTWDEEAGQYYNHQLRALPARPEHRQPRGPRRDREDRRLLARARRFGLPHGRRPLPREEVARAASTPTTPSAGCTTCASTPCAAPATRCSWARRTSRWTTSSPSSRTTATRLHLQLGFLINQRMWLALARGDAARSRT